MKFNPSLYLVTDSSGLEEEEFLNIVEEACKGGVSLVQLREKERPAREIIKLGLKLKEILDRYQIPLIIDDRLDIAMILGVGVHLGQDDIDIKYARKILGPHALIGATAKTIDQARQAEEEGADYLGVGAIFPTTTKVKTVLTKISSLEEICQEVQIPVLAIGGLNKDNYTVLKDVPIQGICLVSAIMQSPDPRKEAEILRKGIDQMINKRELG